jgi:hypothetical protein
VTRVSICDSQYTLRKLESGRTRVDELLLGHLPALVCLDLCLELADLRAVLASCCDEVCGGGPAYGFRRLGLDDELVLLEILRVCEQQRRQRRAARCTLKVIFILAVWL